MCWCTRMKFPFFCLVLVYILSETHGEKLCSYRRYSTTYYYSCSSNHYCCGTRSCCTYVYARWYLWFVLVSIGVFVFILWWYYRYRYRPRHVIVGQGTGVITTGEVNVVTGNAVYPPAGAVTVMPGAGGGVHYTGTAYPPPVYGPVQTYYPPPPAYTSVVKTGTTVTSTTIN